VAHAERQIDQIRRRVLWGESIPHHDKILSIFEPHTEWISKGKAHVPVELGLRVAIAEDQYRFILHHPVMERITDDQVAIDRIEGTRTRFPVLPKKGKRDQAEAADERQPEFIRLRHRHSAVES
jgi:hypothetical protein